MLVLVLLCAHDGQPWFQPREDKEQVCCLGELAPVFCVARTLRKKVWKSIGHTLEDLFGRNPKISKFSEGLEGVHPLPSVAMCCRRSDPTVAANILHDPADNLDIHSDSTQSCPSKVGKDSDRVT